MESSTYLYDQIRIMILKMIETGEFQEGEKIPSELELIELFGASRITVRRAIKELEDEGVLKIVRGKGTFVEKAKRPVRILNLEEGFTDGLQIGNNQVTKVILEKKIITASKGISRLFESEKPIEVLKLVRVIREGEKPISVDYAFLPVEIYPDIENLVGDNISTFRLINNHYKVHFRKAKKEVEIVHPNDEVAALMKVSPLDQIVQIRKIIWDENRPVHYSQYYLRADRIKLSIDIDVNSNKLESIEIPTVDIWD
ncbi:MAG: GntR family transcriptional regulator [Proteiniclasticum sp.]|nr:GntR family transcriptional regulator [Proteiniclasticum sp.]